MKSFDEKTFAVLSFAIDSVERQLKDHARYCLDSHIEMNKFLEEQKDELEELDEYLRDELNSFSGCFRGAYTLIDNTCDDLMLIKETLASFFYE